MTPRTQISWLRCLNVTSFHNCEAPKSISVPLIYWIIYRICMDLLPGSLKRWLSKPPPAPQRLRTPPQHLGITCGVESAILKWPVHKRGEKEPLRHTFQIPDCSLIPETSSSALFGVYDLCIIGARGFLRTRGNNSLPSHFNFCTGGSIFPKKIPKFPQACSMFSGTILGPSTPGKSLFRTSNPFVASDNFMNSFFAYLLNPKKLQEDKGSSLSPPRPKFRIAWFFLLSFKFQCNLWFR